MLFTTAFMVRCQGEWRVGVTAAANYSNPESRERQEHLSGGVVWVEDPQERAFERNLGVGEDIWGLEGRAYGVILRTPYTAKRQAHRELLELHGAFSASKHFDVENRIELRDGAALISRHFAGNSILTSRAPTIHFSGIRSVNRGKYIWGYSELCGSVRHFGRQLFCVR